MKLLVNMFGGPGVGKTTMSYGLLYYLKSLGIDIEYSNEYAKELLQEVRTNVMQTDQLYILAKQHRKIFRCRGKVDYMVNDSPLLLSNIYYNTDNIYDAAHFKPFVHNLFHKYPSLNVVVVRNPAFEYESRGRVQSEDQAKVVDIEVQNYLDTNNVPYIPLMSCAESVKLLVERVLNFETTTTGKTFTFKVSD